MREQFIQFLQQPSPASFLKVREALFEQEDFDPYCSALDEVEAMMSEGKWQMIVDTITRNLTKSLCKRRATGFKRTIISNNR